MIALIVAYAKNRAIGLNGDMPWRIPGELRRFRELTTGNVVIMGRRTFESLGKPLPGRTNIVLSSRDGYEAPGCMNARSLDEAIAMARKISDNIYIGGGGVVYKQALPLVDKMYISEIDAEFEADTFFPEFDETAFSKEINSFHDGEIPYTYVTYTRK